MDRADVIILGGGLIGLALASALDASGVSARTAAITNRPTPMVTVAPDVAGIRIVVASGQRVDLAWTVPADPAVVRSLVLGCHIPGHWAKGMRGAITVAPPRG